MTLRTIGYTLIFVTIFTSCSFESESEKQERKQREVESDLISPSDIRAAYAEAIECSAGSSCTGLLSFGYRIQDELDHARTSLIITQRVKEMDTDTQKDFWHIVNVFEDQFGSFTYAGKPINLSR